ncbi:polysaccharide deacetylase family protein [Dactylosporangium sp. NPDC051485]|uniref:polysaccharide deacetylase family protein n=1 Tax=Dactylosporangium sp. NPDC051485 TaxID=3154846 RepID=UPI0034397446
MTRALSRRRLLSAGLVVGGASLVAGDSVVRATPALLRAEPRPAPSPSATPPPPPPTAPPMAPLTQPVFTLAEYRKVVPGPDFPPNAVALTIDDGPHPMWTPKVLNLLERYHVPAMFCLIGNQVLGHEPLARNVVSAGHQIANHTWSHPAGIAGLSPEKVQQEIDRAQEKIYDTTGQVPTVFRSPGGAVSPAVFAAAAQARMTPVNWDADPRDWTKPGTGAIAQRLMAARPGDILLCHDGGGDRSQTCAALSTVIPALLARGLQFVAL